MIRIFVERQPLKIFRLFAFCFLNSLLTLHPAHAADPYKARAEAVTNYVQTHFYNAPLHLYRPEFPVKKADPRADYAWGAGVWLTALVSAAKHDPKTWRPKLDDFADGLEKYWDANAPVPGYNANPDGSNDKYYDDNAWLVLGGLEAYEVTREKRFLTRAQAAQNFVLSGWDARRGGGICWRADRKSKNTCSNAPAAVAALRLYQITGDKTQLTWARTILTWLKANLQDPSDSLYWDNLDATDGKIGRAKFTYNTALVIRANALLFQLTGDKAALAEARRVADAALKHWADPITSRFGDDALFNHLLAESFLTLSRADHDPRWRAAVVRHADWTFRTLRDPSDGGYWTKPNPVFDAPKTLINNAAVARLLWLLAGS